MTDHSIRRRRMGGTLIGFAALALPLTASITYAQSEAPKAPLPPEAPLPSAETPSPNQPAAAPAPAKPASILRIPPVPPRALEAFGIDPKDFPTVCPAEPGGNRST